MNTSDLVLGYVDNHVPMRGQGGLRQRPVEPQCQDSSVPARGSSSRAFSGVSFFTLSHQAR